MTKRKKIQEIRSAPELLRVNSFYKQPTDLRRNILIAIIVILFVFYLSIMMFVLNEKSVGERVAFIFATAMMLGIALFVFFTSYRRRDSSFVITEKGVFAEPGIAEFWEDIQEYGWEPFKSWNRVALSRKYGEGITLRIINKGLFQRNIERWIWHSVLTQYGIFFNPEQVQMTDKIFQKYGIKKQDR